ncbi:Acetyl-CoA synthetase [Rubellimicrobium mesophilum DSM 19309]|uniref:Acetyl-CoA synthetase n=1 Tax=Rubellimicrobium mesophilum DSM 19309 TaxID=442562 RepID=A0A017HLD0_9RHOB|nr:acetate--CoA ligase family protein [Rubellimicrobium mesophilum]EYD75161.1 Acetyl-CoA synthetase [Rubellimicrobium mesophilum DSM 19309]
MRDLAPPARDLSRLLRPRSVALFGGGWAENVIVQLRKACFTGNIWPVHPKRAEIAGVPCLPSLADLPSAPDAAFVGVNREASVEVIAALSAMGAGGAVCFASGFKETEEGAGADLQDRLVAAAGSMPILGPNCYGFLNALDMVTLWPDQHGLVAVERGIAIVGQSSNVAINLTMQRRGLPIAYVLMAGNQAQTGLADLALAALHDPRVTAVGMHVEGFGDLRAFEAMAQEARRLGKPVVVLKAGRSAAAQAATLTHTASLAGGSAVASAFLKRTGCTEVTSLGAFLETLKLLHLGGSLAGPNVVSVSCSGGEASLMADGAEGTAIQWRPFPDVTRQELREILGPIVTVANPLDYHTFIWGDTERMTATFSAVLRGGFDLGCFVLDLPRADRCSPEGYRCAIDAILAARQATGARTAVLASLPEAIDEALTARFESHGVTVLHGMTDGLAAIDAAIHAGRLAPSDTPALLARPGAPGEATTLSEAESKAALARHGLRVPASATAPDADGIVQAARTLRFPLALKALGVAHKSESGAVALHLATPEALRDAAQRLAPLGTGLLAEEMAPPGPELLVGVTRDPTGLLALTIGAGGVLTELLRDSATLVLPATRDELQDALMSLRLAALLKGYRGQPPADLDALLDAIEAIAAYARTEAPRLFELDVNPLIAGPHGAVAVDALIRLEAP